MPSESGSAETETPGTGACTTRNPWGDGLLSWPAPSPLLGGCQHAGDPSVLGFELNAPLPELAGKYSSTNGQLDQFCVVVILLVRVQSSARVTLVMTLS